MLDRLLKITLFSSFILAMFMRPLELPAQSFIDEVSLSYFSTPSGFKEILKSLKIENGLPRLQVVSQMERVHPGSGYLVETVELAAPEVSSFKIHILHPQKVRSDKPRPVLFILAGINSNESTLELFPRDESAVLVVFEYDVNKADPFKMLGDLPEMVASAPVQIAAAVQWVQSQAWQQHGKFNALAISLGTLFLPLSQRILLYNDIKIDATVLAYGGAELSLLAESLIAPDLGKKELEIAMDILTPLLRPLDPSVHLPLLRSQFLIVHGSEDDIIPQAASEQLSKLTPEPKEISVIPGGHINTDRWDLIEKLGSVTLSWFKKIGTL